jgi:nucleoside-diphosphate-sugar epimerase
MLEGTYLITGITGYIGSLLAKTLMDSDLYGQGKIRIVGLVRNMEKAQMFFEGRDCSSLSFIKADLQSCDLNLEGIENIDYIIHCAATTTSGYMVSNPVETADGIILGTKNMLELARKSQNRSFVYLSSMEAYGIVDDLGRPRKEDELGNIAIESARSCYPLGKRIAEHYCCIYHKEYGLPVKVARLAQTFGEGVRPDDNRVYMQFARAAYEGRDIVLKTQGLSVGNYCAADDAVNAIFTILEKGADGETYNVVNEENTMCIRDMAQLVASEIAHGKIKVVVDTEDLGKTGYAADTALRMSGEKLRLLGWKPTKNLVQMYRDLVRELDKSHIF